MSLERWIEEIEAFLRIPSVSASPEHAPDVRAAAEWVRDLIVAGGGEAELVATKRQPLVHGRIDAAADPANAPTILLYAHFDVQPPGDLALWHSGPFEPEIRDGWIYARGATDDKIHLYMLIRAALDLAAEGALAVNVRILSDGEEEAEGDAVVDWLRADADPVDFALALDGLMLGPGQVAFTTSTRGLCFYSVEVETGTRDLHSGIFGGVGLNAVHVLNDVLAAVVPCPDELAVGAVEPTPQQLAEWDAADDWGRVLADAGGAPVALGDHSRLTGFRPSVDVNGISGGDAELDTTIIPARARAHVSLRLAPGQDPAVVCPMFEARLREAAHSNASVTIHQHAANPGSITDPEHRAVKLVSDAFARAIGRPPLLLPWGASVPVMAALDERGIPNVLTGFGLPDSAFHAPNERFPIEYLPLGITAIREALHALADA
jgi:acetylornithine deacetylase/succinyl-diaminopimelate desuccinylase-like protein